MDIEKDKNITLESALRAYKVMHMPTEFSWKQHYTKEIYSSDDLLKCSKSEIEKFNKRLLEGNVTIHNNIKSTGIGKVITLLDLVNIITDPKNKNIKKQDRKVLYTSKDGERPIGKAAFDKWSGFQVIDMDIKDEDIAKQFKRLLFERLKKYNWFLGIAISSSGKGLHIYTKIQIPESNENDHKKSKILYLTNFRHKYSFVYLACLKIIEKNNTLNKDDIIRWMDMSMFKPQQGAFIPYDEHPLISTKFFEDFIYVNFDNVEDMGHPDVDWVSHTDLKEIFKRWEWFEDDCYDNSTIEISDAPELDVDTKNRYHYKHFERWRLANTLVQIYGTEKGYNYLRLICTNDIRNKELQSDCVTASRHNKPIDLWAVRRLNKYHGFKIKVSVDNVETDTNDIVSNVDIIEDPTALKVSSNIKIFNINKNQYLSDIKGELLKSFGRITLIEAGAGTGKTEMVKLLVKDGKRIVMVMPFTSTIKSKVEGDSEWYYSYGNKKVKFTEKPGLSLTVDKFSKLNIMELKEAGYDYIFIDESHLLFQSEYRPVMSKIIEMIRNTEVPIVMMSGTPIGEDVFFEDIIHLKIIKEETRVKKFDIRLSDKPKDSLYIMCKHMAQDISLGKRILFPTNRGTIYKEQIKSLVKYFLETEHFIFNEPIVNYYKKSNVGEEFMNDVNIRKTINKTDILMCSTYLSVGVDILDKFDFNIYFNEIWTPQEIEQFANRLRSHDLYIRLYLNTNDEDGIPLNIYKYKPCNFKVSDEEIKNAISILKICNGMIERNPVEYKYNSLVSSIISNNKFVEYNSIENKYYLNDIAYKTIFFERRFRDYAQQLPVLVKGMISYGYVYEIKYMGSFKCEDGVIDVLSDITDSASKKQKMLNTEFIRELMELITEDRLVIYKDVMDGKYDIVKGDKWEENILNKTMTVRSIEMFEKVIPIFVSMSKMYDVDDIKEIFEYCTTNTGHYNFAAIRRMRMLINMVYNNKKNRLDLPMAEYMEDIYRFLDENTNDKGVCKCNINEVYIFINDFIKRYMERESKDGVIIMRSPLTLEEVNKSMTNIFKSLVDISRPNKRKEVTLEKVELLWVEKEVKNAHKENIDNYKMFVLNEFLDSIHVKETNVLL